MLRHKGIFQCFVMILSLVGQLSVSGFWQLLCPFGCMFFFSFTACDCSVILCHNKTKNKSYYPGHRGPRGPFLESPVNFSGQKSNIQIKI